MMGSKKKQIKKKRLMLIDDHDILARRLELSMWIADNKDTCRLVDGKNGHVISLMLTASGIFGDLKGKVGLTDIGRACANAIRLAVVHDPNIVDASDIEGIICQEVEVGNSVQYAAMIVPATP